MASLTTPAPSMTPEERLSRAQEAYREYSCRCFWFMDKDLIVTEANLPLIIEGLKLHGGHKGWKLAHALMASETQRTLPERTADSTFRFFPLVEDKTLGCQPHDIDATTNKVLTAAGRDKVRDFIDIIHLNRTYVSLGVAVWAASGKDEGYTPELIIDQLRRHSRINPHSLEGVKFTQPADPVALKRDWLECLQAAETLIASFPSDPLGCFYLDQNGQPAQGKTFDSNWVPHCGSVKGAWPKIED